MWICRCTVFRQINAPCVLTDILVNSGGPEEYSRGFSAIFAHFWPIFAYFEGNIPSERAGGMFIQAGAFTWQNTVCTPQNTFPVVKKRKSKNSPKNHILWFFSFVILVLRILSCVNCPLESYHWCYKRDDGQHHYIFTNDTLQTPYLTKLCMNSASFNSWTSTSAIKL